MECISLFNRLPATRMNILEKQYFPQFIEHEFLYYSLRNVICTKWQANIHTYLPEEVALEDLQVRSWVVYVITTQTGFIYCI